eukprot:364637-Chlamydomonas_euryale.AAC.6
MRCQRHRDGREATVRACRPLQLGDVKAAPRSVDTSSRQAAPRSGERPWFKHQAATDTSNNIKALRLGASEAAAAAAEPDRCGRPRLHRFRAHLCEPALTIHNLARQNGHQRLQLLHVDSRGRQIQSRGLGDQRVEAEHCGCASAVETDGDGRGRATPTEDAVEGVHGCFFVLSRSRGCSKPIAHAVDRSRLR